ncbi:hypothetical protein HJC23_003811 [Cyclotella cryptica]|uniref:Arf-GAP domain-containing protein n=1 Tax=Cyclotella cryptica TaxID=29204 RepID=A0ABD3Q013_9STRA
MENGGNKKVNMIFEAHLNVAKPSNTASGPVRERFIRDKYERRKFYDPNAFALVDQMDPTEFSSNHSDPSDGEQQQVIAGVQRRLAAGNSGNHAVPSIRKPSDAARKRVEERAARNRGGGSVPSNTGVRSKPVKTPVAPAPAPVADLLDFGDFDSPEATAAVASSTSAGALGNNTTNLPGAASSSNSGSNEPVLDLFANMSVGDINGGELGQMAQQQQQQEQQPQKKMTNDDIMSMFQASNQNPMQQNFFAMSGGSMPAAMPGGANVMMGPNGNMGNYNNMMMSPNGNFGASNAVMMNNAMAMPTGINMMMMGVGGNAMMSNPYGNMMGGMNNQMMMMMQQQQQFRGQMQMQPMNGMQNPGMMAQGGNHFGQSSSNMSQPQGQKQTRGGSHDQFAEFGNFGR